jgi:hypothetical protein
MSDNKTPLDQLSPASVAHNKGRILDRLKAPKTKGTIGNAPRWMTKKQKAIWRKLVRSCPAKLGENDEPVMEIAVILKAKLEAQVITNSELTVLINCLNKLGFIPFDRQPIARPVSRNYPCRKTLQLRLGMIQSRAS